MSAPARRWSGWILLAGFAVGLAGMVLGTEAEACCPEPCQWILSSECCDLSPAVQFLPSLDVPALVGRTHDVVAARRVDVFRVGWARHEPRVPLGLRTTVLRL